MRSSVGNLALPFRPLYNNMSLLSFLLFLRVVQECQSYSQFHKHNFLSQTLPLDFEPFPILFEAYQDGVPDRASILQDWTHHTFISCFLHILGAGEKSLPQETKCSIGFSANIADMRIPFQIICNCYTKVFDIIHIFRELYLLRYRKPEFYSNVCLSAASCCI